MLRWLTPDYRVAKVEALSLDLLRQWGIDALLLDADCTLKRYRATEVTPEVAAWLRAMRTAGIGLCLISNGYGRRIGEFAGRLDLPFVARAMKPLPMGCRTALRTMAFPPASTALVGDQVFADVLAGRLAGLKTILVEPIHPEEEPWYTRLKRPAQRWVLRRTAVPLLPPAPG
ncbi:MAG: YqeG family HAD IIIA-type phosphatase [Thermoguttaceae bacterium]